MYVIVDYIIPLHVILSIINFVLVIGYQRNILHTSAVVKQQEQYACKFSVHTQKPKTRVCLLGYIRHILHPFSLLIVVSGAFQPEEVV